MSDSHHIVLLCSRLDLPAGIERAVVNTAGLFAANGHAVTLLILDETAESFYPVPAAVQVKQLGLSFGITKQGNILSRKIRLLSDVLKLRKALKRLHPSLIICTEYPFVSAAILAGVRKYARVVSWEHHHFHELSRNSFWEKMFRNAYPKLFAVVCLNEEEQKLFRAVNKNPRVIPNFIEPGPVASPGNQLILTVGRLTAVKGTDLLLKTAKIILQKYPGWKWKLIGDGDLRQEVQDFIQKESLESKLILQLPAGPDIGSEYQAASLYVMTSRNECFPMTLLEAHAAGLPCISFDCETGPRHLIRSRENGLLVEKENPDKMAEAISFLIENPDTRSAMGKKSFEGVKQFSPEKIYARWRENIFT